MNDFFMQIFSWFGQLTFAQMSWFAVIAYAIHYAEEGPRLVEWMHKEYTGSFGADLNYTQAKLNLENGLLFTFVLLNVIFLNLYPDVWILKVGILASGIGMFMNFVFHAVPTLRDGIYSPGVVTASLFFPYTLLSYLWKLSEEGFITWPVVIVAVIIGPAPLPVAINITHKWLLKDK